MTVVMYKKTVMLIDITFWFYTRRRLNAIIQCV